MSETLPVLYQARHGAPFSLGNPFANGTSANPRMIRATSAADNHVALLCWFSLIWW
jgi:hypothetical protein